MYKASKPPKEEQIQYLKCTKIPHIEYDEKRKIPETGMKKGSFTWVRAKDFAHSRQTLLIEDNKFHQNFDRDCFRPVDEKGRTAEPVKYIAPPKYRFKTKRELMHEDMWNYKDACPKEWTPDMNLLLGMEIDSMHNKAMERGDMSGVDNRVKSTQQVTHISSEDEPDTDYLQDIYNSLPKYRFRTEEEFKEIGEWNSTLDIPWGWGNDATVNKLLGKGVPHDFSGTCDEDGFIKLNSSVTLSAKSYVRTKKGNIDKRFLKEFAMADMSLLKEKEAEEELISEELESMQVMEVVLEKVYDNEELRRSSVPLFIGDPGLGKTKIIEGFAKKKGVKLVELITSQMSPFEISGIAMPDKDSKKMTYYNFDKIETLEDGDILFFDELLNGNPIVLNACLTILEQRRLISGKPLPNIMIIAAANPQGMVPLTPQIKERFVWYNVKFSPNMWKDYMKKKYEMPEEVSNKLCDLINEEEFTNNNFYTPRSIDKAVSMIAKDCPTPYSTVLEPILSTLICNNSSEEKMRINEIEFINPGESMLWLDFLKKSKA